MFSKQVESFEISPNGLQTRTSQTNGTLADFSICSSSYSQLYKNSVWTWNGDAPHSTDFAKTYITTRF